MARRPCSHLAPPIPAAVLEVAFVSVDGVIQHSSTYTLTAGQLTFNAPPANGTVVQVIYPHQTEGASVGFTIVDAASPGDPLKMIPFSELFDAGDADSTCRLHRFLGHRRRGRGEPALQDSTDQAQFDVRGLIEPFGPGRPECFLLRVSQRFAIVALQLRLDGLRFRHARAWRQSFLDVLDAGLQSDILSAACLDRRPEPCGRLVW